MIILKWYLLSLIPALAWAIIITVEDIRSHLGYGKPDPKFGYNWQPLNKLDQSLAMMGLVVLLVPVVNLLVTAWMIYGWLYLSVQALWSWLTK